MTRSTSSASASAIKQSVCKWCFNEMTVDQLAANAKRIGLKSVELVDPTDYADVTKHGLIVAMTNAPGDPRTRIPKGWNRVENHGWLIPLYQDYIAKVSAAGFPNLICFSGNRAGLGDDEGIENCAKGLTRDRAGGGEGRHHDLHGAAELARSITPTISAITRRGA